MNRERLILWLLLAATFAIRAVHPDQPIVENYVGRQIPTAMVARNLERGSGFLQPQLDTGPFPNLFLVEPPIYAQVVVGVRPLLGFDLEPTGRIVSAAATTLAAWGLFGLVRRREGPLVALLALGSFCVFPVMIRYGRAFQPDALMLGCVLAGLRGWDEFEDRGNWRWAAFGGFVLAIGLALKVTVAWALIPFWLIVRRWPIGWRMAACVAMQVPAIAWYVFAWDQVARPGSGSLASFDNANLWTRSLSPEHWLRFSTYDNLARGLIVRSFTPIGFVLAFWGLVASGIGTNWNSRRAGLALPVMRHRQGKPCPTGIPEAVGPLDRLWLGWGVGCALSILCLASKWHHAYYWMVVAPLAAVGVAKGVVAAKGVGRPLAWALGSVFLALCLRQSVSTWRTPPEWGSLLEAAHELKTRTPVEQLVVAPEALLYYADCRGYRLEFDRAAMRRAAGEWGGVILSGTAERPLALTEYYWDINVYVDAKASFDSFLAGIAMIDFYWDIDLFDRLPGGPYPRFGLDSTPGRSSRPRITLQGEPPRIGLDPTPRSDSCYPNHLLVADVGSVTDDPRRRAWREAIRKRPKTRILIDKNDLMIAELR